MSHVTKTLNVLMQKNVLAQACERGPINAERVFWEEGPKDRAFRQWVNRGAAEMEKN